MIFKTTFSVSGDNFHPSTVIDKLCGDFIITDSFNSTDRTFVNPQIVYGYGGMSFWDPKKFATEDNIIEYETAFVDFIDKNYNLFIDAGADRFNIYIEIYYDGEQCNFEIFDKHTLKKLTKYSISFPISVYRLSEQEIVDWEKEIKQEWVTE